MTKRISNLSELTWFNIEDYSSVEEWDYATMLWQLNERRSALIETFKSQDSSNDIALSMIEDSLESGSLIMNLNGKATKVAEGGYSVLGALERTYLAQVVSPLSVYDASSLHRKALVNRFATNTDDLLKQNSDEPKFAYIKVNLSATTSLIRTEMMKWLVEKKSDKSSNTKRSGVAEVIHETMMRKIRDLGIVAFLDLLIWEQLKDVKIDRNSIVDSLQPDSDASLKKDFNKMKKLARQAISANFLSALSGY